MSDAAQAQKASGRKVVRAEFSLAEAKALASLALEGLTNIEAMRAQDQPVPHLATREAGERAFRKLHAATTAAEKGARP